jgi:molecular chaperone DnaK
LSQEDDKLQVGRMTPDIKRLTFKTKQASEEEFVQRFFAATTREGMVLKDVGGHPDGAGLDLLILLADGRPAFHASGRVTRPAALGEGKLFFVFERLDGASQALHARMLELRASRERRNLDSQAERTSHDAPIRRGQLEESLRRMVRIDEPREVPLPLAAEGRKTEGTIIGIDLGTTNSCCAMVKGERPFVIPSRRGHNTVPSVVALNAMQELVVGHAALAQLEMNPERTIYGSKRLVGRPFDSPIVRQVRDRFHYPIVAGPEGEAAVQIGERLLRLEEVSARILEEIRDTAQEYLGRLVERAVITVPAYYNENQRYAVRVAGALAGLQVERILNEPTAAALAYGYQRNYHKRVLVYDLGGGTFDASILEIDGDTFRVLATGGDTFLGGLDFDTQLMDHILIEFQLQLGRLPDLQRVAYLRVLQAAEFAKCSLSNKSEMDVLLPFIGKLDGQAIDLQVRVTREQLESLVNPLIQRTLDTCDQVLAQARMRPEDVEGILLVGGQTRMPMVHQAIQRHFGREPIKGVHPDEAVATGAALLGHALEHAASLELVDTLPISIGVGTPGGPFRKLFATGLSLPTSRTFGLYTFEEGQTELHLPIYQGESSQVDENELLGTAVLGGIPPGPAGSRLIEITLTLTPECLLHVSARDRETGPLSEASLSTSNSLAALKKRLEPTPAAAEEVRGPVAESVAAEEEASGPPGETTAPERAAGPRRSKLSRPEMPELRAVYHPGLWERIQGAFKRWFRRG